MSQAAAAPAIVSTAESRRRLTGAVVGGAFGFFVDMYDVYLPTIALAPATVYFIPASLPVATKAIITALVFVATLFGRPVGSMIFGPIADHVGRKKVTLWSVAGCGAATFLIAFLPGYAQWGAGAVVLMILLRFVDGIFIGGEYTGAMALAIEHSPQDRRGFYGSLVGAGFPLSYCAIAAITWATLHFFPSGGADAPFTVWGWRIPFLCGAIFSVFFLIYYSRAAKDSLAVTHKLQVTRVKHPVGRLLGPVAPKNYWTLFVMMLGVWFASNMASSLLASTAKSGSNVDASGISLIIVIAQLIHTVLFPVFGALSDRIGRKMFFILCGITTGTVCAACFAVFGHGGVIGFGTVLLLVVVIRISGASMFALTPAYLSERYPAALRGTGYGLSYSLPLIVTGFYAYYQNWLGHIVPFAYTPVVLLVLAGVLMVVGGFLSAETRKWDIVNHPLEKQYQLS
ncbi:MFS transporter [Gryllotalpicola ginsengisoli]|uniref:MFS transporter n=1 Tax=Gryllotalpicola ginsengisoli TaxID=444608 RepID=UPI0003B59B41|nr:MFS transporter [Gryllotalpicola ginsengisoli]